MIEGRPSLGPPVSSARCPCPCAARYRSRRATSENPVANHDFAPRPSSPWADVAKPEAPSVADSPKEPKLCRHPPLIPGVHQARHGLGTTGPARRLWPFGQRHPCPHHVSLVGSPPGLDQPGPCRPACERIRERWQLPPQPSPPSGSIARVATRRACGEGIPVSRGRSGVPSRSPHGLAPAPRPSAFQRGSPDRARPWRPPSGHGDHLAECGGPPSTDNTVAAIHAPFPPAPLCGVVLRPE